MPFPRMAFITVLAGLAVVGLYELGVRNSRPWIAIEKQHDSSGGTYLIKGDGYDGNEMISLEIKNAPLTQPAGWHLGTVQALKGKFLFQTEDFRCVRVDDSVLRERYKQQRIIFVVTGLSSGRVATAMNTAGTVLVCP